MAELLNDSIYKGGLGEVDSAIGSVARNSDAKSVLNVSKVRYPPPVPAPAASGPYMSVAVSVCVRWVLTHWRRNSRIVGTQVHCVFRAQPINFS